MLRKCESTTMAKPSVSMPDELLESFDKTMMALKLQDEMDQKTKRSELIRQLMEEWIEENRVAAEGNFRSTPVMTSS